MEDEQDRMPPRPLGQTLAEKLIARAAGRDTVRPDEIVICRVDLAMMQDMQGPRLVGPMLDRLGATIWDRDKVVVVSDHFAPGHDAEGAAILQLSRNWVRGAGLRHFYDLQGISHVVLQEGGHLRPGMFAVGGDSHAPSAGALGAFMMSIGSTEMCGVLVLGEIWVRVPHTIRITWSGTLQEGVAAKDMALRQCAILRPADCNYKVVEYHGSAIASLPIADRFTLCNMAPEMGLKTELVPPDATTAAYLTRVGALRPDALSWQPDPTARYAASHGYDATGLPPQVAAPGSPANAAPVAEHTGVPIDQAYIGACTGAKLHDLHLAARVLRGRTVAAGTRLMIAPASRRTMAEAARDGTLATLMEAGAILLPTGCGGCAGLGAGALAAGETCIASTAANFAGRMGDASARIYLGSPYTVAASALAGHIADPRMFLA